MKVSLRVKRALEAQLASFQVGLFLYLRAIFNKTPEKLSH